MQAELNGLLCQFKEIYEVADTIGSSIEKNDSFKERYAYVGVIEVTFKQYEEAHKHFSRINDELNLRTDLQKIQCPPSRTLAYMHKGNLLRELIKMTFESKKAVGVLEKALPPISKKQFEKLKSLREELKALKLEEKYEKNLIESLDELGSNHNLASSLISSRVTAYCIDVISEKAGITKGDKKSGTADDKMIQFMIKTNIVKDNEKDVKSSILRAARLARNVLSHNLDIPTTKEAFSLLTDAFKLSEIVSKLQK